MPKTEGAVKNEWGLFSNNSLGTRRVLSGVIHHELPLVFAGDSVSCLLRSPGSPMGHPPTGHPPVGHPPTRPSLLCPSRCARGLPVTAWFLQRDATRLGFLCFRKQVSSSYYRSVSKGKSGWDFPLAFPFSCCSVSPLPLCRPYPVKINPWALHHFPEAGRSPAPAGRCAGWARGQFVESQFPWQNKPAIVPAVGFLSFCGSL